MFALAITGPTASGKTAISLPVAKALGCEIICCDSMQIYKEMSIGTAKATAEERSVVPHYMLDFLSPTEDYSVESYRTDALNTAKEMISRGVRPMFVGGTGLYLDALTRAQATDVPESSREYRDGILQNIKTEEDIDALWQRLYSVDPESATAIHKNNVRRVIRALEIYDATGKTKSYFDRLSREARGDIDIGMITLDFHDRENLYRRVDMRVDIMMREGLLEEVRSLYERGLLIEKTTAAQAIGYKEIVSYLEGKTTLSEAVELIKLSSRRYAKRQLTWFRHKESEKLFIDDENGVMKERDALICEATLIAEKLIKDSQIRNEIN